MCFWKTTAGGYFAYRGSTTRIVNTAVPYRVFSKRHWDSFHECPDGGGIQMREFCVKQCLPCARVRVYLLHVFFRRYMHMNCICIAHCIVWSVFIGCIFMCLRIIRTLTYSSLHTGMKTATHRLWGMYLLEGTRAHLWGRPVTTIPKPVKKGLV